MLQFIDVADYEIGEIKLQYLISDSDTADSVAFETFLSEMSEIKAEKAADEATALSLTDSGEIRELLSLSSEYENFAAELERIKAAGLKGVKVHPDFQEFRADVESMDPVYAKMAELKLPVLFHAGDCRYDYSNPKYIANVHKKHPELVIIAAHFGGYTQWDEAYEYLCGTDVYFDTSSTLWKLPVEKAKKMIAKHGYEKFLFGTDYPMWIHSEEIESLKVLGFTPEQTEAVMYKNALGLFKKCGIEI